MGTIEGEKRTYHASEWRVRRWIRVCGLLVSALLAVMATPQMEYVLNPEGIPDSDKVVGYVFVSFVAALTWSWAFRPRVRLSADGVVEVVNPFSTRRFAASELVRLEPNSWGVEFVLRDGSRYLTTVFQDTRSINEPRWFDLAEAVTGSRPKRGRW